MDHVWLSSLNKRRFKFRFLWHHLQDYQQSRLNEQVDVIVWYMAVVIWLWIPKQLQEAIICSQKLKAAMEWLGVVHQVSFLPWDSRLNSHGRYGCLHERILWVAKDRQSSLFQTVEDEFSYLALLANFQSLCGPVANDALQFRTFLICAHLPLIHHLLLLTHQPYPLINKRCLNPVSPFPINMNGISI